MIKPINEYKDEGELHRDLFLNGYRPGTYKYEIVLWMFRTTIKQRNQEVRLGNLLEKLEKNAKDITIFTSLVATLVAIVVTLITTYIVL